MNKMKHIWLIAVATALTLNVSARQNVNEEPQQTAKKDNAYGSHSLMKYAAQCEPASASADLDINNVRTRILNGGDMWWDLANARYEIPKIIDVENAVRKNSLFAGAIWIGGEEEGVLKLAAMTYRQNGSDFWPGPLDTLTGNTNENRCAAYDNIYKITKEEIVNFVDEGEANGGNYSLGLADATNVASWPAHGNGLNVPYNLAPFFDKDGNNEYNPENGDYPVLQTECRGVTISEDHNGPGDQPDQMLWFVYNDRGNIHTESQALPIGLEMQTTAFAYRRNDEINNMTFYTTRIINRGSNILENTYFGEWVDPDLGNFSDDYVGCDVELSLGFCYNGDDNDEGILGYGLNPPSVGVDFFEGPKRDTTIDGVDTAIELGMSKFVYYNNDFTNYGNPQSPIHYYNYLRGRWKNGDPLTADCGNARTGSQPANYIFPGMSDTTSPCANWTEKTAGNTPSDRRFLQTSGPFTLQPGAVNKITVGVVWARTSSGGATGSLELLKAASRKAQNLFDNCFDLVNGPNAPDVLAKELDQEVIFLLTNTNNDKVEGYHESVEVDNVTYEYAFQGYRIYQLADATVGTGDIGDVDKVREVFICDKKDDITRLVNNQFDAQLGEPLPQLKVDAPNNGIIHSISITDDAFATGSNSTLVNNKTYYYLVLSYAALPGHPTEEYLEGGDVQFLNVTPQKPFGTKINGKYGSTPELTRMEGIGNGGQSINLTDASLKTIMEEGSIDHPIYKAGAGPVNIKVVDPLKVPKGEFEFILLEDPIPANRTLRLSGVVAENTNWILVRYNDPNDQNDNDTIYSEYTIDVDNEQLIVSVNTQDQLGDWGMAVNATQVLSPGNVEDKDNGLIEWEVLWDDNSKQWLTAIPDMDNSSPSGLGWYDWIRSGSVGRNDLSTNPDPSWQDYFLPNSTNSMDQFEVYEKIWDGRFAPYRLAARNRGIGATRPDNLVQGPAFDGARTPNEWGNLNNLHSIDIVLTPDESKWTQVMVLELGEEPLLNEGGAEKFDLRDHASLNKDGSYSSTEKGRSWFPGYAIDVESGKRMNIIIGEDSYQQLNNGRDMKWNPTDDGGAYSPGYPSFGGRHYLYFMGFHEGYNPVLFKGATEYDGCQYYLDQITAATFNKDINMNNRIMFQCSWLMPAYLANGFKMKENANGMPVPPTEVKFRVRVKVPYGLYNPYGVGVSDPRITNNENPRYLFNTDAVFTEKSITLGEKSLEGVRVVPNPYFAFSAYETSPVDNRVKITNLPAKCQVSIYTIDGSLVRRIRKDDPSSELQWDLKNSARVPIGSGTYLIHIDGYEYGEAVVTWLGIMRELDLDSF